ncbi:MAG TPA: hypothetical protein VMU86_04025 [Steroidobacteraceae bacterium]|nr:hypothetical protein [Steroidobacteraceae bacterium]
MRVRNFVVPAVLLLVALFFALNWPAITVSATFTVLFAKFSAPLGLVMLVVIVLLVATFGAYLIVAQGTVLLDSRRHAKELQSQRLLAEQAEASRLVELRELIGANFDRLDARLARLDEELRGEIHDAGNSLAATIAEIDDRLRRGGDAP